MLAEAPQTTGAEVQQFEDLRFSSVSFQILTKLWFGSLDENVVRGLVLNI